MKPKSLEELTQENVNEIKKRLEELWVINDSLSEEERVPDEMIRYAQDLQSMITLNSIKDPKKLMDEFFKYLFKERFQKLCAICRSSFCHLVDGIPKLAPILLPGEFADEVKNWYKINEYKLKAGYNNWYRDVFDRSDDIVI